MVVRVDKMPNSFRPWTEELPARVVASDYTEKGRIMLG